MKIRHLLLAAASLTTLAVPAGAQDATNGKAAAPAPAQPKQNATPPAPQNAADATTAAAPERKADMTVVVVATRIKDSPYQNAGTAEAITLDDIRNAGAVTLPDAFKYVPGVDVQFSFGVASASSSYTTGGDRGINVRGIEGDRVAILADGISQPDEFNVANNVVNAGRIYFDPAVYGQVEIYKTAASSLYGSGALGGAVAVSTTGPAQLLGESLQGEYLANTATYATANRSINNLVQAAAGNGIWAGSLVYSFRKGHESETRGSAELNPQTFQGHAVVGKVERKFDTIKLQAVVDYYYLGTDVIGINASGSMSMGPVTYEYFTPTQDIFRERLRFSLGADVTAKTAIYDSANVTGYWQDSKSHVLSHDITRTTSPTSVTLRERYNTVINDTEIRGINSTARKAIPGATVEQLIQYGVEVSFADNTMSFTRLQNGTDATPAFVMAPSQVYRAGLFLSDKIAIGTAKRLVITPSLRTDYYNVDPDNTTDYMTYTNAKAASYVNWSISPGLSALYKITPDINIYGLYAMGTRNPTAGELNGIFNHAGTGGMAGADQIRIVPNKNLRHETANNFELGLQGNTQHHAFRLAAFYNLYDNFIETLHDTGQYSPDHYRIYTSRNLDKVDIYGLELSWNWRVNPTLLAGIEGLHTGLSFAWTEGRHDTDTGGREPLNSVEPWKLVAHLGYTHPDDLWGIRLTGTLVGKKSTRDIDSATTYAPVDSYFVLDLTGFYTLTEHWRLTAGINNLTNKEYYPWATVRTSSGGMSGGRYAQPGINGFISLTAKF